MGARRFTQNSNAWTRWLLRLGVAAALMAGLSTLSNERVPSDGGEKLGVMRQELARARAGIAQTQDDIVSRRRHVEALKTNTLTIETIARQELHMLYPHEKILRLGNSANRIEGVQ